MRSFSPDALRKARQEAGISQERLAQRIGSTKTTIQSAELGRTEPRASLIVAVADQLGVDLNSFFVHGGDGEALCACGHHPDGGDDNAEAAA